MSDVQSGAGEQSEANAPLPPAKGTSPLRLVILLLIFGIALAGLLYDYCIARPAQKDAYNKILGLLDGSTPDPSGDGTVTDDEVQSILGNKPTGTKALTNGKIETYSWRSGLPYRTYFLYVVYSGQKMPLLHFASTEEPLPSDLPPVTVLNKPTQQEIDDYVPTNPGTPAGPGARAGNTEAGKKDRERTPAANQDAAQEQPQQEEPQAEPAVNEDAADDGNTEVPATEEPAKPDETPAQQESGDQ